MICKECEKQNLKSKVTPLGTASTLLGWSPYYDENGKYHSHDPNKHSSGYRCSNGHQWSEKIYHACPDPDCDYGKKHDK